MAQTLKPATIRLTEAMLCNALENNVGYCIVCGADHDGCGPMPVATVATTAAAGPSTEPNFACFATTSSLRNRRQTNDFPQRHFRRGGAARAGAGRFLLEGAPLASSRAWLLERVSHARCRGCFRRASHCIRPPATRGLRQLTRGAGRCYACLDRGSLDCRAADSQSRAETLSEGCFGIIGLDHYAYSPSGRLWTDRDTAAFSLYSQITSALSVVSPWIAPLGSS